MLNKGKTVNNSLYMTKKEFLNRVANSKRDIIEELISTLEEKAISYCIIGGLAVNAYVEPVVTLDIDIVIISEKIDVFLKKVERQGYEIRRFAHSINLEKRGSDLRIQIQLDQRYFNFIKRAQKKAVLGYRLMVATLEDVLQGKIWAYMDKERRPTKRQKDLLDILRIVESYPELIKNLPLEIKERIVYLTG